VAINTLADKIAKFSVEDGTTESKIANLTFFRASAPEEAEQGVYNPCIIIVGQGQKCAYFGDLQIQKIAEQSGFGSATVFCRNFKKEYSQSPREYRDTLPSTK